MLEVGVAAAIDKPQSQTRQRDCFVHLIHAISDAKEDITTSIRHLKKNLLSMKNLNNFSQ